MPNTRQLSRQAKGIILDEREKFPTCKVITGKVCPLFLLFRINFIKLWAFKWAIEISWPLRLLHVQHILSIACKVSKRIRFIALEKLFKLHKHFTFFLPLIFTLIKNFSLYAFLFLNELRSWTRKKVHAVKVLRLFDNKTEKHERTFFQLDIFGWRTTRSACRLFLGFMFRTVFAWAYKSDITKIPCYSLWYTLVKLSWEKN